MKKKVLFLFLILNITIFADKADYYDVDVNSIVEIFKINITSKADKIIDLTLIILTLIICVDLGVTAIKTIAVKASIFTPKFIHKIIKYTFYIGLVSQFLTIQSIIYDFFVGIASFFGADIKNVNEIWNIFFREAEKLFNLIIDWGNKRDFAQLDTLPEVILIIAALLIIIVIAVRTVIELVLTIFQFYFSSTLSLILIPLDVNEKTRHLGMKLPTTFITSGLKIIFIMIIAAIGLEILSGIELTTVTKIDDIKDGYEAIFKYISIIILLFFLLLKSSKIIQNLT